MSLKVYQKWYGSIEGASQRSFLVVNGEGEDQTGVEIGMDGSVRQMAPRWLALLLASTKTPERFDGTFVRQIGEYEFIDFAGMTPQQDSGPMNPGPENPGPTDLRLYRCWYGYCEEAHQRGFLVACGNGDMEVGVRFEDGFAKCMSAGGIYHALKRNFPHHYGVAPFTTLEAVFSLAEPEHLINEDPEDE